MAAGFREESFEFSRRLKAAEAKMKGTTTKVSRATQEETIMNDRPSDKPENEPRGLGCTGVVMPLIRCACVCLKVWDVAFVPWSFRPQDAFQCSGCKKWCKSVQLFRDGDKAPPIEVEA